MSNDFTLPPESFCGLTHNVRKTMSETCSHLLADWGKEIWICGHFVLRNTGMSTVSDASLVSSLSALSVGDLTALPPVRLIPFDIFKQLGQMPRCPENRDILVNE